MWSYKLGTSVAAAVTAAASASGTIPAGTTLALVSCSTASGCHFRMGTGAQTATTDDPLVGINPPLLVEVSGAFNTFAGIVPVGGVAGRLVVTKVALNEA